MNFYVSLVFLGIILVVLSLVLVFLDKKKVLAISKNFDEKKQELVEIINDAEQMIEELNRFSDYIVTQMDLKNEELGMNIKAAEEGLKNLALKAQTVMTGITDNASLETPDVEYKQAASMNGGIADMPQIQHMPANILVRWNADIPAESMAVDSSHAAEAGQTQKQKLKRTEKVIPIKNRYGEVLRLAESGLSELDIAKTLNMGKGEVELILGLNKS